jgi:hypothetical protein
MKTAVSMIVVYVAIVVAALVGEVKCIIKMASCDWNPIGKSEIIYTVGTFTGFGAVIGYLNIKD